MSHLTEFRVFLHEVSAYIYIYIYIYIDDVSSCLFRLSLKRAVSSFDIPEEGNCFLRQPCI